MARSHLYSVQLFGIYRTIALVTPCVVGGLCSGAAGQVFDSAHREILTSIQAVNAPDFVRVESDSFGLFDEMLEEDFNDDNTGDYGFAQISQRSVINDQAWNASGAFFSSASTDASALGRSEISTSFIASETMDIFGTIVLNGLELGEPGGFSMTMSVEGLNSGLVFQATRFDLEMNGPSLSLVWDLELEPDTYTTTFVLRNSSFKDTFNRGSYTVGVFIPAPSTAGLLGFTGLAAIRRRRP